MEQEKRSKKKNMDRSGHVDIDAWRANQVRKRTLKYFQELSDRFAEEHGKDTDEQLIEYVRQYALSLRRMPKPLEVPGGLYIERRLNRWLEFADEFGVVGYDPDYKDISCAVYRNEYKRQEELFREERKRLKVERTAKSQMKRQMNARNENERKKQKNKSGGSQSKNKTAES